MLKPGVARRTRPLGGGLPVQLRALARRCAYVVLEGHSRIAGLVSGAATAPPSWLPLVGAGDFQAIGHRYLGYFVDIGRLQPSDHVLDVGCGLGRMAVPLAAFLDEHRAKYCGFDVDERAIRWCRRRIGRYHPNFTFDVADVENRAYRHEGAIDSATYRFPYPDASFDFAIATSVFTHLLPDGAHNYVAEVARVLRPGGRAFMTFFLLNDQSLRGVEEGTSKFDFVHDAGTHRLIDPEVPEAAVALPESDVTAWLRDAGMHAVDPVYYGSWSGRRKMLTGQDVIVAVKKGSGLKTQGSGRSPTVSPKP